MSIKLRDLIRSVRACKTAAEERAVISKECALIRTAIKEEEEQFRHRNVAKLMYIHMLGYPTHFGQMECLKLISAASFPEKRIGYLALTLLLTEQAEVLTLVTNSLKVDLTNNNQYIQALALIAIGNLATQDMARDLASDVERILQSSNSYLRKKAALATIKLLKREPDLIESMGDKIAGLLKDKTHGVLITGIQLITDVIELIPDMKAEYVKLVPSLVRLLRNFISMGFSPEHDVGGITDPFVQVKIIRLLKLLGKDNDEASEQMNDVLAQVATNTETAKNSGNAILYECVQTIMGVESDSGLRVLAVNILGRFLLNRDNNIRYVALNSLSKVISEDVAAVQRHRATIVDCLKDADVSIRQRALELIYQLVNESNVVTLISELLNYLIVAQTDHKPQLVSKIMLLIEKFSPSKKWRLDTVITMLTISGNQIDDSVARTAIIFIAQSDGHHGYAAHRLYRCLQEDTSQQGLLHVAIWCIGEYGDLLIRPCPAAPDDRDSVSYEAVQEDAVLGMLDKCMRLYNADVTTKGFLLNSLMKLSIRLPSPQSRAVIKDLVKPYMNSMSLELQQRSAEYSTLLNGSWERLRPELMGKMPILDEAAWRKKQSAFDDEASNSGKGSSKQLDSAAAPAAHAPSIHAPSAGGSSSAVPSLLDLDDIFGGGAHHTPLTATPALTPLQPAAATPLVAPASSSGVDLLADIFSSNVGITPTASTSSSVPLMPMGGAPLGGMPGLSLGAMGVGGSNTPMTPMTPMSSMTPLTPVGVGFPPAAAPIMPTMPGAGPVVVKAFEKGGLQIIMELSKPNPSSPDTTRIVSKFVNLTGAPMDNLVFQAAVPKYLKLEMLPATSASIPANSNGAVTQEIRLVNSMQGEKSIMLKLKIGYTQGGMTVDELAQVSTIPPLY